MKWIRPADVNPHSKRGFRLINAFNDLGRIEFPQNDYKFRVGDIVYIYAGRPEMRIIAKCLVCKTDKHELTIDDFDYSYWQDDEERPELPVQVSLPIMELEPIVEYEKCKELSLQALRKHGIKMNIQGPCRVTGKLENYLSDIDGHHILREFTPPRQVNCYNQVLSFPCGDTFEMASKWGVHAHPIKRGQPPMHKMTRCALLRAKGGVVDTLYEIENTIDVDPDDVNTARKILDDKTYRRLLEYHVERENSGYGYSPYMFRFYILRSIYTFKKPVVFERNARNVELISPDQLPLPDSILQRIGFIGNASVVEDDPEDMGFEELRRRAKQRSKIGARQRNYEITQRDRDPYIAAFTKRIAKGRCQLCRKKAPFMDKKGKPFLEVHHIVELAKGGADALENTVALCPNCHRKMHVVNDANDKSSLRKIARNNAIK